MVLVVLAVVVHCLLVVQALVVEAWLGDVEKGIAMGGASFFGGGTLTDKAFFRG